MLETPTNEEINFGVWPPPGPKKRYVLGDVREAQAEMKRRREHYPDIDVRLLARGVPVVGRTGAVLNFRLLEQAGIMRDECWLDNSLRCLPSKSAQGANWPTGNARHIAVSACRQYDRIGEFKPTVVVLTCHPASLFKEVAPELLIVEDLRKAKEFADQGERVLVLMGGKAAETFLGFALNISRWRGHYEFVDSEWLTSRVNTLKLKAEKARRAGVPKEKRERKKTKAEVARTELAGRVIDAMFPFLRHQGTCCCGASFVEKEGIIAELTGRVATALTPLPRPKKIKAIEVDTQLPPCDIQAPDAPESDIPE